MEIEIFGHRLQRISRVNQTIPKNEPREWLRSVFIERKNGHAWIGATDSHFAAIEHVGVSTGDDGFIVLRSEAIPHDIDDVKIADMPALEWCVVGGSPYQGDCAFRDPEALRVLGGWRNWFPSEAATAPGRPMFADVDGLAALVASSPSGRVVFPRIIDSEKPVYLADVTDSRWRGVFFAQPDNGAFLMDGASLPGWL